MLNILYFILFHKATKHILPGSPRRRGIITQLLFLAEASGIAAAGRVVSRLTPDPEGVYAYARLPAPRNQDRLRFSVLEKERKPPSRAEL